MDSDLTTSELAAVQMVLQTHIAQKPQQRINGAHEWKFFKDAHPTVAAALDRAGVKPKHLCELLPRVFQWVPGGCGYIQLLVKTQAEMPNEFSGLFAALMGQFAGSGQSFTPYAAVRPQKPPLALTPDPTTATTATYREPNHAVDIDDDSSIVLQAMEGVVAKRVLSAQAKADEEVQKALAKAEAAEAKTAEATRIAANLEAAVQELRQAIEVNVAETARAYEERDRAKTSQARTAEIAEEAKALMEKVVRDVQAASEEKVFQAQTRAEEALTRAESERVQREAAEALRALADETARAAQAEAAVAKLEARDASSAQRSAEVAAQQAEAEVARVLAEKDASEAALRAEIAEALGAAKRAVERVLSETLEGLDGTSRMARLGSRMTAATSSAQVVSPSREHCRDGM